MENEQRKYWFFGSKLNTVLLVVLIVLMVIAIRIMLQNKEKYLPILTSEQVQSTVKTKLNTGANVSTTLPKYMGTMASGAGWPPVIKVSTNTYSCNPGVSNEVSTVVEKTINGKKYCVSSFIDAAAGSRGGEYTYTRKETAGTKVASFSLRWPNCGVYGGPGDSQYEQCNNSQAAFFGGLDSLIDNLMK